MSYIDSSLENIITIKKVVLFNYEKLEGIIPENSESHNFWEFAYVVKGDVYEIVNGRKIYMSENDILFYPPNKPHSTQNANLDYVEMCFVSFVTNSKAMDFLYNYKESLSPSSKEIIKSLISEGLSTFKITSKNNSHCITQKNDAPIGGAQMYKVWLEALLINILREHCAQKNVKVFSNKNELYNNLYNDVCLYLDDNIYGAINLDELCSKFNYSSSLLCKKFKEFSGQSIIEYYNKMKISEACKLIRETEYSITYISTLLNFNNPYYFSKVFKKNKGLSPKEYKTKIEQEHIQK